MTQIYFIVGSVGSGKTTFAKKLATEKKAFRFNLDEWMIPLYGEHMERELFDARKDALSERFKERTKQFIAIGVPVIFDFGFLKKSERQEMILWAESLGASREMIWIDTPKEECERRALNRNDPNDDSHFIMTPEMLDMFWGWFEKPDKSEKIRRIA